MEADLVLFYFLWVWIREVQLSLGTLLLEAGT